MTINNSLRAARGFIAIACLILAILTLFLEKPEAARASWIGYYAAVIAPPLIFSLLALAAAVLPVPLWKAGREKPFMVTVNGHYGPMVIAVDAKAARAMGLCPGQMITPAQMLELSQRTLALIQTERARNAAVNRPLN